MRLTGRDEQLIARCWEDRLLSTSQLHQLFFGTRTRCNERLRILYSNHYLNRYFLSVTPYRGAMEALYTVGKRSSGIVSLQLGLEPNYIALKRRRFEERMTAPSFLYTFRHLYQVNHLRAHIEHGLLQSREWQQMLWIPECLLEDRFRFHQDGQVHRTRIRADGFFQYQHQETGKLYSAFLETDLGTMSQRQILSKGERYLAYFSTSLPEAKYGTRWFRVLVVTTTRQRASTLQQTLEQVANSVFWLTSMEQIQEVLLKQQKAVTRASDIEAGSTKPGNTEVGNARVGERVSNDAIREDSTRNSSGKPISWLEYPIWYRVGQTGTFPLLS